MRKEKGIKEKWLGKLGAVSEKNIYWYENIKVKQLYNKLFNHK